MNNKNNVFNWRNCQLLLSLIMVFIFTLWITPEVFADSSIKLIIDGQNITASPKPFIKNDRTLVPIRIVSEQLGAKVIWNNDDRTVEIIKDNRSVLLRIDSNLTKYGINNEKIYNLSDIAPQIIDNRTFVPLRLVSNALGVGINWDNEKRAVIVDSSQTSSITPFFDMKVSSLKAGQVITGTTNLQAVLPSVLPTGASEIKYLLLSRDTAKGFIIGRGKDLTSTYNWMPSIDDNGEKILVAAIYDNKGKFLAGDSVPVQVSVSPQVALTGLVESQLIVEDKVPLGAYLNFSAAYVKYEIINTDNGAVYISPELDPKGPFNMIPVMEDNGNMSVKVIAYDNNNNPYPSKAVNVVVNVERKLALGGVSAGKTIDGPVILSTSRNFDVSETEYVMQNPQTGIESTLYKAGYGNYSWFPGPDMKGNKVLFVRVKDKAGNVYTSAPISVVVSGNPRILLQGVGPNQVITGTVSLKSTSNVPLDSIKYTLINSATGAKKVIAGGSNVEYTYTPIIGEAGTWSIMAEGWYAGNNKIETEKVPVTIYTKETYKALPIIEKGKFLGMASELSKTAMKETGMSAALQTAQAILETGWGQSVPVDKYNGQFSNNLFGIKGTGSAGSVISNTWEEYNGVSYRIDAKFRAYNSVMESWKDHNELLLTANRYDIYREVMHDSTQGAWALRRAGYATDSKYPMKLMEIIKLYNLRELDKVGI